MKVGIIGLESSGKRSLFSLLTGIKKEEYGQSKERIGVIDVPDDRIDYLVQYYKSKKTVYSKIEFCLMPSLKKGSDENSKTLLEAKESDMFAIVLRQFADENVFHPSGTVDLIRDYNAIKDELIFADLYLVQTRLDRIEKQLKTKKTEQIIAEQNLLLTLKEQLEKGNFLNKITISENDLKQIKSLCFLTLKPVFAVVNCDEARLGAGFDFPDGARSINVSTKIEDEIQQLDEKSKSEFLGTLGLKEAPLDRMIRFAYEYGDMISFLTAGEKESHSWTIKNGSNALKAAGAIHSDIEKGFIRAEVVNFEDFKKAGSESEAKKQGLYRLEGKEYIVKDGDMIEFRFNV